MDLLARRVPFRFQLVERPPERILLFRPRVLGRRGALPRELVSRFLVARTCFQHGEARILLAKLLLLERSVLALLLLVHGFPLSPRESSLRERCGKPCGPIRSAR